MEGLRRAASLLLVAAVAALLLGSTSVAGQDPGLEGPDEPRKEGVTYEWWDGRWHMRVPVLVRPQMPDHVVEDRRPVLEDVEDVPVHVEIDFTDVIRRIGDSPDTQWPQEVDGSLNSFTFDTDSVRVVRYDRDTGTVDAHGRTGDVVPSLFNPTLHERRDLRNDRFDPSANAVGTVTWIAEGTLDNPRLYFVYFDIEENGAKDPLDLTPEERGALDSLRWIRPGTDAYGYIPADRSSAPEDRPALEVYGLYEDTAVQVERYAQSGFDPAPLGDCDDTDTGLCVEGGRTIDGADEPAFELQPLWEGPNDARLRVHSRQDVGFHFRVTADKPVLVAAREPDTPFCPVGLFYPGQQGLVSTEFTFVNLANPPSGGCTNSDRVDLRFVAPTESASVTWTWLDSGLSETVTVPKRGSATFDLPDNSAGRPVHVEASSPVAVVQPGDNRQYSVQAPAPHGAPVGDRVLAPMLFEIRAFPWDERAEVTTFDTKNPGEDMAEASEVAGPGAGDPAHFVFQSFDFNDFRGNVWETSAEGADVAAYHDDVGLMPVSGPDGMDLRVPFDDEEPGDDREPKRLILYPPYERTEVTVTRNATGEAVLDDTLGLDEFVDRDSSGDPVIAGPGGVHVDANKPLLAVQAQRSPSYATYYPTVTRGPLYTVGEAEFHGNLIRWDKPLRTPTMAPGQEDRFTLSLTNLGREIGGGNLPDDIEIEQEVSRDWDVTLTTQVVRGLDSFESRDVTVAVSVPEEAETGTTLVVNLTAISQGNPEFEAFSQIKITVQTLFDVELTFRDADCNPKSCERLVDAGDSTLYGLRVNNTGTGDDEYTFSISESRSGFEGRIEHRNGSVLATPEEAHDTLAVPRGQDAVAFVNVTAPDDAAVTFPYEAVIQAKSEADSSANSQVVATTVLSVNTNFRVEAAQEARPITPGETTTFPLRVVNEGDDTVLDVETSEPSLGGWNVSVDPSSLLLRANGTTAPDGTRGDVRTVDVNITAAEDARVGEILPLEVTLLSRTAQGTTAEESTRVRAIVANNFTLAKSGLEPRSLQPGETFRYQFNVRNAANGPFTTTVNATGLPEGWAFEKETPTSPTELDVGDSLDVDGDLVLPPGTPSGRYNVTFSFFSETPDGDRGVTNATGLVQVSRRSNLQVEAPADVQHVPPGNVTRVPLDVTNAGNVDMTARLDLRAPADWSVAFRNESQSRLPLAPGESEEVDVLLGAPAEIGDGPVTWGVDADLPLRDVQRFDLEADWIKTDLTVADVQAVTPTFETGETSVLAVTVRNDGSLPANNVDLAVVLDGEPAENVTIGTLPPNEDRVIQVPWTVAPYDDSLEVVIDPFDRFVETDETNNAHPFSPRSESAVPAPGPAIAALAAAGAALARRRWTP